MKHLKHLLTVALASVLALLIAVPAFASDNLIKVTGLEGGETSEECDVVNYYQVIEWSTEDGKWVLTDDFEHLIGTDLGADQDAVIKAIAGEVVNGTHVPAEFTMAKANIIAGVAAEYATPTAGGTCDENGVWQLDNPAAGLYMVVVTAAHPNIVYNPIFVGADYVNNTTNVISAAETYIGTGDTAVAKKTSIGVTKTATDTNQQIASAIDSKVGETVNFQIQTTLPVFLSTYTERVFNITDAVTPGITIDHESLVVTANPVCTADDYDVTWNDDGFTIAFTDEFLASNTVVREITVTYDGTITNDADFNINYDSNTVTVDYSNGPDGETGALKDLTNHYTFSLGAQLFGTDESGERTWELVKVAVDENGEWVVEPRLVSDITNAPEVGALAGAVFGLYTDEQCTTPYTNNLYPNDLYPNGAKYTTQADGVITFKGLADGTYWLKEDSAPAGYVGDTQAHKVQIVAHYKDEPTVVDAHQDDNGVWIAEYSFYELEDYTVIIDDNEENASTYSYSITLQDDEPSITETVDPVIKNTNINNTPGVELPSTGGIGTTIFYVVGGAMVLCGIVMFITKRRIAQIEE